MLPLCHREPVHALDSDVFDLERPGSAERASHRGGGVIEVLLGNGQARLGLRLFSNDDDARVTPRTIFAGEEQTERQRLSSSPDRSDRHVVRLERSTHAGLS
ncbi:MAG: hypothetical protein KF850_04840 [Labilithrix sp.]|nr:hypothetical protein [Labilithrix sp.]MBX3211338.1 hypothetical protein [Labilithrix sp.]